MADWLKVYRLAPRVVVMMVNERRENSESGAFKIRAEARVLGHTISATYDQRVNSDAELDAAFSTLGAEQALNWLRNQHTGWNGGAAHA